MSDAAHKADLPPGWRPEWRAPTPKHADRRNRARAETEVAREPLPPPSELYERAIRAAVAIAEDATESTNGRVGALRLILEAVGKAGAPPESGKLSDAQVNARLAELRSQLLAGGEPANGEANDDDGKRKEP